jgi:hypothetical protein
MKQACLLSDTFHLPHVSCPTHGACCLRPCLSLPHPQAPLSSREPLALSPVCPGRASCHLMQDRSTSVLLYCQTSLRQYRRTAWPTVLPPAHKTAAAWCSTPLGLLAAAGHATLQLCPGTPQVCDCWGVVCCVYLCAEQLLSILLPSAVSAVMISSILCMAHTVGCAWRIICFHWGLPAIPLAACNTCQPRWSP